MSILERRRRTIRTLHPRLRCEDCKNHVHEHLMRPCPNPRCGVYRCRKCVPGTCERCGHYPEFVGDLKEAIAMAHCHMLDRFSCDDPDDLDPVDDQFRNDLNEMLYRLQALAYRTDKTETTP